MVSVVQNWRCYQFPSTFLPGSPDGKFLAQAVDSSAFSNRLLLNTRSKSFQLFDRKKLEGFFSILLMKEVLGLSEGVSTLVMTCALWGICTTAPLTRQCLPFLLFASRLTTTICSSILFHRVFSRLKQLGFLRSALSCGVSITGWLVFLLLQDLQTLTKGRQLMLRSLDLSDSREPRFMPGNSPCPPASWESLVKVRQFASVRLGTHPIPDYYIIRE